MGNFEKEFNANPVSSILGLAMQNAGKPLTEEEKKIAEESLYFEALNAYMKPDRITEPIFFLPFSDSYKDKSNGMNGFGICTEPFNNVVFPVMMDAFNASSSWDTIHNFGVCYTDAFICYLLSNFNIIFEDGINSILKKFSDESLVYIFNDTRRYNVISGFISEGYDIIFNLFKRSESEGNNIDMIRMMFDSLLDIKAYVADKLSFAIYNYINDALTSGHIDMKGLSKYIIENNVEERKSAEYAELIESSMFANILILMLNIATDDVRRCVEMTELLYVGYFYKLTDLFNFVDKHLEEKK